MLVELRDLAEGRARLVFVFSASSQTSLLAPTSKLGQRRVMRWPKRPGVMGGVERVMETGSKRWFWRVRMKFVGFRGWREERFMGCGCEGEGVGADAVGGGCGIRGFRVTRGM